MIGYVLRRLLWAVVLVFAMSLMTFVIFFIVPPEEQLVRRGPASIELSLRDAYDLGNLSVPAEYAEWVWTIASTRSLGESFADGVPVNDTLARAIPVTASLVAGGVLLFLLVAVPVGVVSALRPRSLVDRLAMVLVLIGISAHPAWIGLVLSYFFGFKWSVTPIGGYCDFVNPSSDCGGAVQWAHHLVLPWATFAILFAALYARMIRATILETLDEDYVRTARAKGATPARTLRAHVARNALFPIVTMLGMDVGLAFGGTVFVESVYGLPGVGRTALSAMARRDLPVLLGVVLFVTTVIAIMNLIVDVVCGWLDPRVRAATVRGRAMRVGPARFEARRGAVGTASTP